MSAHEHRWGYPITTGAPMVCKVDGCEARRTAPVGHPDAEPEDMGMTDAEGHDFVLAPLVDALPIPRRVERWCRCGWHEANHPGFTVADHIADWR